jgi:hypothetical protein
VVAQPPSSHVWPRWAASYYSVRLAVEESDLRTDRADPSLRYLSPFHTSRPVVIHSLEQAAGRTRALLHRSSVCGWTDQPCKSSRCLSSSSGRAAVQRLPNFLARVRRHCASFRWKPPRLLHLAGADRRDLIRDGPGVPLARGWSWRAAAEARHY